MGRRLAIASAALLATGSAGSARAAPPPVGLPSPSQQLTVSPPLQGNVGLSELRIPGRVSSRQRVFVAIAQDGRPVSMRAIQRLTLRGKGDYSFVVPAPLTDVAPAAGTDSQPGFRKDAIVWQGFSPGLRVLAAETTLRTRDAVPSLPVRVSIRAQVGGADLRPGERRSGRLALDLAIANATAAVDVTFGAEGVPAELARVLDSLRETIEHRRPFVSYVATLRSRPEPVKGSFEAPLALTGTLRFPHGRVLGLRASGGRVSQGAVMFSARLGDGSPMRSTLHVEGQARALGPALLSLRVEPVLDVRALRPPRGRTWTEAIARGLVQADGRRLLSTTIGALLRVSRARQYGTVLADPDALVRAGADRTVYEYRTVVAAQAAPARLPEGGNGVLVPVLAAVGAAILAGGLVILWAHS